MTHLPLDPFSIFALLCIAAYFVVDRRRRARAHWTRHLRSGADIASNKRGAP